MIFGFIVLLVVIVLGYLLFFWSKSQVFGRVYCKVAVKENILALTFDDGPNGVFTKEIASILDKHNVKGTFFQVGENVKREPDTTRALFQKGHTIANHSYSHSFLKPFIEPAFTSEILKTQEVIYGAIGERPKLFRPPWFLRQPAMLKTVMDLGMLTITGTFAQNMEFARISSKIIVGSVFKKLKPGAILVFHDGYNVKTSRRDETMAAIKTLAPALLNQGWRLVKVSELLGVEDYL